MKYGYVRVALHNKKHIDKQIETLKDCGVEEIIVETTGRDLDELLSRLQPGDSIHVVSLDRISRKQKIFMECLRIIRESKCNLYINDTLIF